jgi:hypothetical protein
MTSDLYKQTQKSLRLANHALVLARQIERMLSEAGGQERLWRCEETGIGTNKGVGE